MAKTELHKPVDALPDEFRGASASTPPRPVGPDVASYDDEELTGEDLHALKEARSESGIAWSDAEAELNAG